MGKDKANGSGATEAFSIQSEAFAGQYSAKVCFRDRLFLFGDAVQKRTSPSSKILDFGCGPGIISIMLAQMGYVVVGIDGAPGMIQLASRKQKELALANVTFKMMSADDLSLPQEEFDGVVCSSVLEYIRDDMALLNKLICALKPGGHIFVSIPSSHSLGGVLEDAVRFLRRFIRWKNHGSVDVPLGQRRYNRQCLLDQLQKMGVDCVQVTSFEWPMFKRLGVRLSRYPLFGIMLLVVGRKVK